RAKYSMSGRSGWPKLPNPKNPGTKSTRSAMRYPCFPGAVRPSSPTRMLAAIPRRRRGIAANCSRLYNMLQGPVPPMLAKLANSLPEGEGWIFEPKWDGFRAIVFRDGDDLLLQSRDLKPLNRYFPALEAPLRRQLPRRAVAQDWFSRFEGAGFDGVVAKRADQPYQPDKRTMLKIKHQRTADCVVAGFRWHKNGPGTMIGSLLLGLYDREGKLHHVGVTS